MAGGNAGNFSAPGIEVDDLGPINQADQLDYIADILDELREMAKHSEAETLSHLLSIVQLEATRIAAQRRRRG